MKTFLTITASIIFLAGCEFSVPKHPSEQEQSYQEQQQETVQDCSSVAEEEECQQGINIEEFELLLDSTEEEVIEQEQAKLDLGDNPEEDCYDYLHRGNLIYIDYRPCAPGETPPES